MTRLVRAWRAMLPEHQMAAVAALGLFVSMFLPWYSKTVVAGSRAGQTSQSAIAAFSFVEAAVLLVSAGVLTMLFARAEGRDFHLPGSDGAIVMIAGGWAALLIFYRLLDKPALQGNQKITATVGLEWGIFIALLLALGLLYAGARIRSADRPQPPLTRARRRPHDRDAGAEATAARGASTEEPEAQRARMARDAEPRDAEPRREQSPERAPAPPPTPVAARGAPPPPKRPRYPPAPAEQLSFEDPPGRPR